MKRKKLALSTFSEIRRMPPLRRSQPESATVSYSGHTATGITACTGAAVPSAACGGAASVPIAAAFVCSATAASKPLVVLLLLLLL